MGVLAVDLFGVLDECDANKSPPTHSTRRDLCGELGSIPIPARPDVVAVPLSFSDSAGEQHVHTAG
jgi:hypothetical protein